MWQATDVPPRIPVSHCHFPPRGLQPRRGPREQEGGRRKAREEEGGRRRERPARIRPRPVHASHLWSSRIRPHHGPRLKMHERRERPGGRREFAMATRPQLSTRPYQRVVSRFCFRSTTQRTLGTRGCVSKGTGRKVGPMLSSTSA